MKTREERLVDAACVFLLDRKIRAFLDKHDPRAVEQAIIALGFDPRIVFRERQGDAMNRFRETRASFVALHPEKS